MCLLFSKKKLSYETKEIIFKCFMLITHIKIKIAKLSKILKLKKNTKDFIPQKLQNDIEKVL